MTVQYLLVLVVATCALAVVLLLTRRRIRQPAPPPAAAPVDSPRDARERYRSPIVNDQQRARDALRRLFPDLLGASLEEGIARCQERAAAESIAAELMAGAYDGEKFARFCGDCDYVRRPGTPADWKPDIVEVITEAAEERLVKEGPPASKHHTGPRLRRIVADQVDYDWDTIRRRCDERCEARQSDWFATSERVRRAALMRLADQLRSACIAEVAAPVADERPLKARLKALTILIDERIPREARTARLRSGRSIHPELALHRSLPFSGAASSARGIAERRCARTERLLGRSEALLPGGGVGPGRD